MELQVKKGEMEFDSYNNRRWYLVSALAFLVVLLSVFYDTAWSMISIWIRSETFTHGFLIIPVVVWMIWGRRLRLQEIEVKSEYKALFLLAGAGFLWLLAHLVDVLVIQQFSLVIMAISGLWVILGSRMCWAIAFPLAYLLFLVPIGEGLVPLMMEFTATFTVAMVKLSGIPVYREGLFFYLPSGNWSVVEACSGVRYLIASVTLGSLYAYLTYYRVWKRSVFIVISFIVPVIANGLRAFIIVMLGHWSDMTIATGVDHLIYGWLFFGLVMLILFAVGNLWRDDETDIKVDTEGHNRQQGLVGVKPGEVSISRLFNAGLFSLVVVIVWPLLAYGMEHRQLAVEADSLRLPEQLSGWKQKDQEVQWRPNDGGSLRIDHQGYAEQDNFVQLVLHHYLQQSQGSELVSGQELLIPEGEKKWRVVTRESATISLSGINLPVKQVRLKDGRETELLVWSWYRVGDRFTANDYEAKLFEALSKLTFGRQDSARFFLVTPIAAGAKGELEAEEVMKVFLQTSLKEITGYLDQFAGLD